MRVVTFLLQPI